MSLDFLTKLLQVKLFSEGCWGRFALKVKLKVKSSRALRSYENQKLEHCFSSCHMKGHKVHTLPPSKRLVQVNNSECTARYTLVGILHAPTVSVCFVPAASQIIYEKKEEKIKCTVPRWRIGYFSLSPSRHCKQSCRVWWGLVVVSPETWR